VGRASTSEALVSRRAPTDLERPSWGRFSYRNEFVAGWTGPAQVEKGVTEPSGYAVLDVAYVGMCRMKGSLTILHTDVAVLWKTVLVMARGEGIEF
jgi:hypothetical protein